MPIASGARGRAFVRAMPGKFNPRRQFRSQKFSSYIPPTIQISLTVVGDDAVLSSSVVAAVALTITQSAPTSFSSGGSAQAAGALTQTLTNTFTSSGVESLGASLSSSCLNTFSSGTTNRILPSLTGSCLNTFSSGAINTVSPGLTASAPFSFSGSANVAATGALNKSSVAVLAATSTSLILCGLSSTLQNAFSSGVTIIVFSPEIFITCNITLDNVALSSTVSNPGGQRFTEPVRPTFDRCRVIRH